METTLLTLGVLLVLIGLIGQIKAKEIEVGTHNPFVRIILGVIGTVFVYIALSKSYVIANLPSSTGTPTLLSPTQMSPVAIDKLMLSTDTALPPLSTLVSTTIQQPTSTSPAIPTPMLISKVGRVIRSDHFDSLSTLSFSMYGVGDIDVIDGHLLLAEKITSNGDPTADGEAAGRSNFSPQPGNASVFLFKVEENTYFGYHFELYETTDIGEQYIGINLQQQGSGLNLNFWKNQSGSQKLEFSLPVNEFQYGTWYYYSLQVQPDGLVIAQLWERDQPANVIFDHSLQLTPEWAKPGFTFVITTYQGKMEVDEYQEVELADK